MPEKKAKKTSAARPRRAASAKRPQAKASARPRAKSAPKAATASGMITILQVRSGIGCNFTHKRILRSLGLRHPHHRVVRPDNPAVRGMVEAIPHRVQI